jgi:tRNA-specific 2-thiouridylase
VVWGRVVVAMSGGVDSSVVACVLKDRGYDVVGATLSLYEDSSSSKKCCSVDDISDARMIAAKLDIPHYVLDERDAFRLHVVDDFVRGYLEGLTPVPCARCNGFVKIKSLVAFAKKVGATHVATGHYAKIVAGPNGKELHRSANDEKDQTHFLYSLSQDDIDFLMFPLEDMKKSEVRAMARNFSLFVSEKKESQDICFVPDGYVNFIKKHSNYKCEEGNIVDVDTGKVLGVHKGFINYTVGQRKGIGVSSKYPLYVAKIDPVSNVVYVGPREGLYSNGFFLTQLNFLDPDSIVNGHVDDLLVCVRALKPLTPASLGIVADGSGGLGGVVSLKSPVMSVTPGQVCAIYRGTRMVGGGIVKCLLEFDAL